MHRATLIGVVAVALCATLASAGGGAAGQSLGRPGFHHTYHTTYESNRGLSKNDLLRRCFCWDNATRTFCGGEQWYRSDACTEYVNRVFWYTVPLTVVGAFFFLLFPLLLLCGRVLCGCCGGRFPSKGACCPREEERHRFPGYSNMAIFLTKGVLGCLVVAYAFYTVGITSTNISLHSDIDSAVGTFLGDITAWGASVDAMAKDAASVSPDYISGAAATHFAVSAAALDARGSEMRRHLNSALQLEGDATTFGRKQLILLVCFGNLVVLLVAFVAGLCNVRGKPMGVLLGVFSVTAVGVVLACFLQTMIAITGGAVCDNYNATVVPAVVGSLENIEACGSPFVIGAIEHGAVAMYNDVVTAPAAAASAVCAAVNVLCAGGFKCPGNSCDAARARWTNHTAADGSPIVPDDILNDFVDTVLAARFGTLTIADCASKCDKGSAVQRAAATVKAFYDTELAAMSSLVHTALPATRGCHAVRAQLHGALHATACGPLSRHATSLAVVLLSQVGVALMVLLMLVRGVKRFRRFHHGESFMSVAKNTGYYLDARANHATEADVEAALQRQSQGADAGAAPACVTNDPVNSPYFQRYYGTSVNAGGPPPPAHGARHDAAGQNDTSTALLEHRDLEHPDGYAE
jgi:hypothetical protein